MSGLITSDQVAVVRRHFGGLEIDTFPTPLDAILAMMQSGAISRVPGYYGSDKHLKALDEIEKGLAVAREAIAKDREREEEAIKQGASDEEESEP
jgi:hypothetical protein